MPHQENTRSLQMTNKVLARFKPTTFIVLGIAFLSGILHHSGCFIVAGAFRDLKPLTMPRFETLTSNEAPTHGMDYCHTQALPTATHINSWLTMNNLEPATLFKLY